MDLIPSHRPETEIEELKAERSYYRSLLDDLSDRANLYGANAFEKLKNHIISKPSSAEIKQIYWHIRAKKRCSGLRGLFFSRKFEIDVRDLEALAEWLLHLQEQGHTVTVQTRTGDREIS
jgi:hypothetical protein